MAEKAFAGERGAMNQLLPFAPGDIFLTASTLDEGARFPTGQGRVLQYDSAWTLKGSFETGHTGLISSLTLDRQGTLHILDPQARAHQAIGPDGIERASFPALVDRAYGSMLTLADGSFLMGEHMVGEIPGFSGKGKVYQVDADGGLLRQYDTETNGGMGGFLGVTHMALSPDGKTLYHTSETGAHVYAHDLVGDRRLGAVYTRDDLARAWYANMTCPKQGAGQSRFCGTTIAIFGRSIFLEASLPVSTLKGCPSRRLKSWASPNA
jgi:hypothetical protein